MQSAEENLNNVFGDIDLELLDLILKGQFEGRKKILDVGCGEGRNLIYFFQHDFDVYAMDSDRSSVELVKYMAKNFGKDPQRIFQKSITEDVSEIGKMDAVICSRVLHFSENEEAFLCSWRNIEQLLKPGGLLFFSMDTTIGFQNHVTSLSHGKYQFKDGSVRFLLSHELLNKMDVSAVFENIAPVKTIHYDDQHAQTILCLKKR